MWNIIIGVVFLIGGLSGRLQLRFIDHPHGLTVVGGLLIAWGAFQLVRERRETSAITDSASTPQVDEPGTTP